MVDDYAYGGTEQFSNLLCYKCLYSGTGKYPVACDSYCFQQAVNRKRRAIGIVFERLYVTICQLKIYMFGVTALTGYVVGYMSSFPALLFFELVIATIGTIATCTWTGLGVLIQKFYLRHFRVINIILALTLLECIWGMLR